MQLTEQIILLLGILSSATLILSALSLHRGRILIFALLTSLITGIQYGLHEDLATLLVCTVGAIRAIVILGSFKYPRLGHWLMMLSFISTYIALFVLFTKWNEFTWVNTLPTVGAIIATVAFFFKDILKVKILLLFVGGLWLTYEFNTTMYTQMIGESFTLVANLVAAFIIVKSRKSGIPESELVDIDTQIISTITNSIPVIKATLTGSIPVIRTDTKPLPIQHTK